MSIHNSPDSDTSSIDDLQVSFSSRSSETDSSFCLDVENERDSDISASSHDENKSVSDSIMEIQDEDSTALSAPTFSSSSSSSDSETTVPSDDNEIWDISDSDSGGDANTLESSRDHNASTVTRTISLFLVLFQLTFRLSEKAIITLLAFLRALFSFLASLCQASLLAELAINLPRSVYGIRRYLKHTNEYIMYVVCTKLYHIHDCILNVRGHQESRLCDHIEFTHHPHANQRAKCNTTLMKKVKLGGSINLFQEKHLYIVALSRLYR